jgi:hypothetical protein
MNIKLKLAELSMAKKQVEKTMLEIKEFVKSDASINDRWQAYLNIEELLPRDVCYFDLDQAEKDLGMGTGGLTYYDDLYMDRHAVSSLSDILTRLQNSKHNTTNSDMPLFREAIMQSGHGSTENDW